MTEVVAERSYVIYPSTPIFASAPRGMLSQNSKYTLMVPDPVSVQNGLCVHIPCSFTSEHPGSEQLEGYWFQKLDGFWYYYVTRYAYFTVRGVLVAVNHKFGEYKEFVKGRFQITGDVMKGNCSLSILDVRLRDAGEYYFRVQNSKIKHNYKTSILRVVVTGKIFLLIYFLTIWLSFMLKRWEG
uniref:Uncharacterized protein n=1 Tax=Sphaerodactylus townsendi TaxID=933632 RepID=A0ACB8FSB0_9SAUR